MTEPALRRLQTAAQKRTLRLGSVVYTDTGTTYSNLFWHLRHLVLYLYRNEQLNREILTDKDGYIYRRADGELISMRESN